MKYLKPFNEELNKSTYINAAKKLAAIKHINRSKELENWSILSKVKEKIREYSKFGEVSVELYRSLYNFHVIMFVDNYALEIENDGEGSFWVPIGLIPKDEKTLNFCLSKMEEYMFEGGFFWALGIYIKFNVSLGSIEFNSFAIDSYDKSETGPIKIADRKSAVTLKKILVNGIGNPDYKYPSMADAYESLYDEVEMEIGSGKGFSIDYGFTPEQLADYIKAQSVNLFYKD